MLVGFRVGGSCGRIAGLFLGVVGGRETLNWRLGMEGSVSAPMLRVEDSIFKEGGDVLVGGGGERYKSCLGPSFNLAGGLNCSQLGNTAGMAQYARNEKSHEEVVT